MLDPCDASTSRNDEHGWPDGRIAHDAHLTDDQHDLLAIEIERLRDLVGDTRVSPPFPAPNQRGLVQGV